MNQSLTCLDISFTDLNIHIIFECKIDSSFLYIEKNPIHNPSAEEKAPLFFNLLCLIHTLLKKARDDGTDLLPPTCGWTQADPWDLLACLSSLHDRFQGSERHCFQSSGWYLRDNTQACPLASTYRCAHMPHTSARKSVQRQPQLQKSLNVKYDTVALPERNLRFHQHVSAEMTWRWLVSREVEPCGCTAKPL